MNLGSAQFRTRCPTALRWIQMSRRGRLRLNWVGGRARTEAGTRLHVSHVGGAHEGGLVRYRWSLWGKDGGTATGIRTTEFDALLEAESVAEELER